MARAWAGSALAALAVLAVAVAGFAVRYLADLAALGLGAALNAAVLAAAGWWAFTTRRAWKRRLNLAVGAVAVLAVVADVVVFSLRHVRGVLALLAVVPVWAMAARRALAADERSAASGGMRPGPLPASPWLLVNPWSGGGKAEQVGLADAARRRGVRVRLLEPGDDPRALARAAVGAGADAVGVAGGDGSLGPVAAVALERDVPFVCVPTGTRNHFARDLGLDRGAPLAALDAFGGWERRVDVGMVGDRVFLNNVSLGAYADLVAEPGYRAGKLATAHAVLPARLRGEAPPLAVSFHGPDGRRYSDALVLLVSNNAYELRHPLGLGLRERLDAGLLQVSALWATTGSGLARLAARVRGRGTDATLAQWTATALRVDALAAGLPAGIDGEAAALVPPLEFRLLPRALRVLVPAGLARAGEADARLLGRGTVRRLWAVARDGPGG